MPVYGSVDLNRKPMPVSVLSSLNRATACSNVPTPMSSLGVVSPSSRLYTLPVNGLIGTFAPLMYFQQSHWGVLRSSSGTFVNRAGLGRGYFFTGGTRVGRAAVIAPPPKLSRT